MRKLFGKKTEMDEETMEALKSEKQARVIRVKVIAVKVAKDVAKVASGIAIGIAGTLIYQKFGGDNTSEIDGTENVFESEDEQEQDQGVA